MKMKTRVFFLDKVYFSEILQADTIIAESKKYDVNVMRIAEYINDVVGTFMYSVILITFTSNFFDSLILQLLFKFF